MGLYWYGAKMDWDMLPSEEKQLYEIVYIQDDLNNKPVKLVSIRPRICSQCGAPIKAYGDYCEYCGVRIAENQSNGSEDLDSRRER